MLCLLEFRKSVILFARFAKSITESSLQIHLHVCKGKTVCLPKIWIFILILGRRNSRKLTCGPVAFNLIGKHEIIDLTAAAKVFANIIDCSAVGYALYLIALFAIFLTLRLNVLLDNVYCSSACGQQAIAM